MHRDDRYFIEALHRGLRVLEVFSERQNSLSLVEIASAVDLDKSTAFRFVYTLEELGYLERDAESKRYRPGLKVLTLGFAALNSLDMAQRARPYLRRLFGETGEAINMGIRDKTEVVLVERISPDQIVNINLHVGSRLPVHCTSMGKVQLIDLSDDELQQLLGAEPLRSLTPRTITRLDALSEELEQIRRVGYAVGDEELAVGVRSLAAPIRQADGAIVAAVDVSVSSARFSRAALEASMADRVLDAARNISFSLGARL